MKAYSKQYPVWAVVWLIVSAFVLQSCGDDDEAVTWVDLRYNPQDLYELPHTAAEEIVFEVSSTKEWKVYGTAGWYSISPAEGEAGQIYEVRINAQNNTSLDDRVDTVTIQSDYWIGKRFVLFQKGTAFINLEPEYTVPKDEGETVIAIESNQDWSLKVSDGNDWLSIPAGASGSLGGSATLRFTTNKGERRSGTLDVFDRNNKLYTTVKIVQEGVTLDPERFNVRLPKKDGVYKLLVESNTEWKVLIPEDANWIQMDQTTFDGDTELQIGYLANPGPTVRKAELTFETIGGEGVEPISKTFTIKQAPTLSPARYKFNEGTIWGQWTALKPAFVGSDLVTSVPGKAEDKCRAYIGDRPLGIYTISIKETDMQPGDQTNIYLGLLFSSDGYTGYSYSINSNGQTELGANGGPALKNVSLDLSKPHTITVSVAQEDGNLCVEWWLDDEIIDTYTDTSLKPMTPLLHILLGLENASWFAGTGIPAVERKAVFDWWEYSEPVDWGD